MEDNEQRLYDTTINRIDPEANATTFELADAQLMTLPGAFPYHKAGQRGVLVLIEDGKGFRFWPYPDQRLRRWPEKDLVGNEANGFLEYWSWRLEGSRERISCKPHFVPGTGGAFVEDQTKPLEIDLPPEFFELCESRGLTAEQVLRGFVADLCELQNYVVLPREDGYSSNGSDERMYAMQWFDRAYPTYPDK